MCCVVGNSNTRMSPQDSNKKANTGAEGQVEGCFADCYFGVAGNHPLLR